MNLIESGASTKMWRVLAASTTLSPDYDDMVAAQHRLVTEHLTVYVDYTGPSATVRNPRRGPRPGARA